MSDLTYDEGLAVSRSHAQTVVRKAVLAATGAGGVAGALPIPFVDVAVAAPIQIWMLNAISARYGLPPVERDATMSISLAASAVAAQVGRRTAKAVTKAALKLIARKAARFIPVVGPIVGGVVSGAVAAASTAAMGAAWIKVCEYAVSGDLKRLDEFLESTEGRMVLTAIAALGISLLAYTAVTTSSHKVIPTAAAAVPKLSRRAAIKETKRLKLALEVATRRAEAEEEAKRRFFSLVEIVSSELKKERNRQNKLSPWKKIIASSAGEIADVLLVPPVGKVVEDGMEKIIDLFSRIPAINERLEVLLDSEGGQQIYKEILKEVLRQKGLD